MKYRNIFNYCVNYLLNCIVRIQYLKSKQKYMCTTYQYVIYFIACVVWATQNYFSSFFSFGTSNSMCSAKKNSLCRIFTLWICYTMPQNAPWRKLDPPLKAVWEKCQINVSRQNVGMWDWQVKNSLIMAQSTPELLAFFSHWPLVFHHWLMREMSYQFQFFN